MSVLILYNLDGIIHTFKVQRQSRTLPYLSKNFVGRENELQDMIKTMNFSSDEVRVLNIIGPPGFGKSTLAIHLGHKLIDLGVGVHYINMAEYVKRNIQLVLAEKILTSSKKITKFDKLLNWVGEREGDEVVLILDNCDEVLNSAKKDRLHNSVIRITQASSTFKVVMTSREIALQIQHYKWYQVGELSSTAAVKLLEQKLMQSKIPLSAKEAIANLTGNVPLALHIVGSLLTLPDPPTPASVIEELERNPIDFLSPAFLSHEEKLNVSINLSYKYLSAGQRRTGYILALFPGSFTKESVKGVFDEYNRKLKFDGDSVCETILKTLLYRSLLEHNERSNRYQYHRLIKEFFLAKQHEHGDQGIKGRFKVGFRYYFLKELHRNTVRFNTRYVDALQFLDDEKHNIYGILEDLKRPQKFPERSLLLTVDSITLALDTGYLSCRFTSTELREYLSKSVKYFDNNIIDLIEQAGRKRLFDMHGKMWTLSNFYERVYVQLIIAYSDLLAKLEGKQHASNFMETSAFKVDFISRQAKKQPKQSNTHLTSGSHSSSLLSHHIHFYKSLCNNYLDLKQHSKVVNCHLKIIENARECKTETCTYKEIAFMYKETGNFEEVARFLELSLKMDPNDEISKAENLLELLSAYKHLNTICWKRNYAENEQETISRLLKICHQIDDQTFFSGWEIVTKLITTLKQLGEEFKMLEERLFKVMSAPGTEFQLQPRSALKFLEVVESNYTKTVEWGLVLLKPFEGYKNLSILEQFEVLNLRLKVSVAKFRLGNYTEGLNGVEYVHNEILKHSQDAQTQEVKVKELKKITCFYLIFRAKYIYSCYQGGIAAFVKIIIETSLYNFPIKYPRDILYLIFVTPFGFSKKDAKIYYPSPTPSKRISTTTDIIIEPNAIQRLTDGMGIEIESLIFDLIYPLVLQVWEFFTNKLFLIILNILLVYIRMWIFFSVLFTLFGVTLMHIALYLNMTLVVWHTGVLNESTISTKLVQFFISLTDLCIFISKLLAKSLQNPWGYVWLGIYLEISPNNLAQIPPFQPNHYYLVYLDASYRHFFRGYMLSVIKTINFLIPRPFVFYCARTLFIMYLYIGPPFCWFLFYQFGLIH